MILGGNRNQLVCLILEANFGDDPYAESSNDKYCLSVEKSWNCTPCTNGQRVSKKKKKNLRSSNRSTHFESKLNSFIKSSSWKCYIHKAYSQKYKERGTVLWEKKKKQKKKTNLHYRFLCRYIYPYICVVITTVFKTKRKITNLGVQMFSRRKDTADKANNADNVFFLPRKSTRANANINPKHKYKI